MVSYPEFTRSVHLSAEYSCSGGELKTRFDENGGILNVCQAIYMTLKDANEAAPSQGFAAKIPDSYLQSLQSFTDDVAYIGTTRCFPSLLNIAN